MDHKNIEHNNILECLCQKKNAQWGISFFFETPHTHPFSWRCNARETRPKLLRTVKGSLSLFFGKSKCVQKWERRSLTEVKKKKKIEKTNLDAKE